MESVLYILAAVLSLIGLATVIKEIVFSLFCSKGRSEFYHIVCLRDEDSEMVLRDSIEMLKWSGGRSAKSIIAVDMGLDSLSYEMCRLICRDYNIRLCTVNELKNILNGE